MGFAVADIDECALPTGGHICSYRCINFPGSFQCSCPSSGYRLAPNGRNCQGEHAGLRGSLGRAWGPAVLVAEARQAPAACASPTGGPHHRWGAFGKGRGVTWGPQVPGLAHPSSEGSEPSRPALGRPKGLEQG